MRLLKYLSLSTILLLASCDSPTAAKRIAKDNYAAANILSTAKNTTIQLWQTKKLNDKQVAKIFDYIQVFCAASDEIANTERTGGLSTQDISNRISAIITHLPAYDAATFSDPAVMQVLTTINITATAGQTILAIIGTPDSKTVLNVTDAPTVATLDSTIIRNATTMSDINAWRISQQGK